MKRILGLTALVLVLSVGAAWSESPADDQAGESAQKALTGSSGDSACAPLDFSNLAANAQNAWLAAHSLRVEPAQRLDDVGDCPPVDGCGLAPDCENNFPCGESGVASDTDSEETSCRLPTGTIIKCTGGQTIHILVLNCHRCPCCTTPPVCVCPHVCAQGHSFACE